MLSKSSGLFQRSCFTCPARSSVVSHYSMACLLSFSWIHLYGLCCPWWLSLGHGISKITLVHCCNWVSFSPITCDRLSSCVNLNFSTWPHGPSTATETVPSQKLLLDPQNARTKLLSMTPSCLPNQHHLGDSYLFQFSCQQKVHPWLSLAHSFFEISRNTGKFYFRDAGFILITS